MDNADVKPVFEAAEQSMELTCEEEQQTHVLEGAMAIRRQICDSIIFICCVGAIQTALALAAIESPVGRSANHDISLVLFGINLSGVGLCTFFEVQYVKYWKKYRETLELMETISARNCYNAGILSSEAFWLASLITGVIAMFLTERVACRWLYSVSLGLNAMSLPLAMFGKRYARP
jgi:hypothetical protein